MKRQFGWLFFVALVSGWLVVPTAWGQAERPMLLRSDASVQLMQNGRRHLLDMRLAAAEKAFRQLARQPDGQVAAFVHLSTISLLKAAVTDQKKFFDQFASRSDSLKALLDALPDSKWVEYLHAEADLQRAVAWAKTEQQVKAALAGRSAFKHFERVTKEFPDFYEAYAGMGLLHLTIGTLPRGYRGLLKILGFSGSIGEGMKELKLAAERSRLSQETARAYLGLIDVILNSSMGDGVALLRGLHQTHSQSTLFMHLYAFALLTNREAVKAEKLLREAVRLSKQDAYFYVDYIDFYLAEALFKQNRFDEAERVYRVYLARHRGPALKATAYLRLGMAVEMQGRRDEAARYYQQVQVARAFDSDEVARRAANKLLKEPMEPREKQLLLGRNHYDAGHYAEAIPILNAILQDDGATREHKCEAAYRLGRVYHAQDRFKEALDAYEYAIQHPGDPDTRWAPWAQLYVGEIYMEQGQNRQATNAFEAALAYQGDFDYHRSLEQRAKTALQQLQQRG